MEILPHSHRAAEATLVLLSAVAGALLSLLYRCRTKTQKSERDPESIPGVLAMFRAVVASLPDPIFVKDSGGHFLVANQAAADAMGVSTSAELLGKTDFDFYTEELASGYSEDERKIVSSGQPLTSKEEHFTGPRGQTRCLLTTKVPLRAPSGRIIGIIGIGRNITALKSVEAELERARDALEFKAAHDQLTTLLNRGAILEILERELARSVRENGQTAILVGDLDHFKRINDTYGHPTGDEVLLEVARRLTLTVRNYDSLGRIGGEEFLIVLPGCAAQDAMARAEQLRETIAASPISTAQGSLYVTVSVGVIVAQGAGLATSKDVLREADVALYAAKAAGRNRCKLAEPGQPSNLHQSERS
jgi:diguanylate cyclase (GGDEF)-like protein/PAS domain S-box-containing protein